MHAVRKEKDDDLKGKLEKLKVSICMWSEVSLPLKTQRAVDLVCEKGASSWLTAIPQKNMNFDLSKGEFRDALMLRYDWPIFLSGIMTWNFIARHNFGFTYLSDSSENQLILHVLVLWNSLTINFSFN